MTNTASSPSPTRRARVRSAARSLPAPGSLNNWHHTSWQVRMRGRKRARCSSLPNSSRAAEASEAAPMGGQVRARAISSATTKGSSGWAPGRPPYSAGQSMPRKPASYSLAVHSRIAGMRPGSGARTPLWALTPGACSATKARTFCRKLSSSGVD